MCNHRYIDYESLLKDRQFCYLKDYIDLPIDKDGKCIFHSIDIEWKQKQNFLGWLTLLKDQLIQKQEHINFSEFHFVKDLGKGYIDYIPLLTDADLLNSTFHHIVLCENIKIQGNLNFKNCTLYPVMRFVGCDFEGECKFAEIDITDYSQIPLIIFRDCTFSNTFYYVDNPKVKMNLSFQRCNFHSVQLKGFSNEEEFGVFDCKECTIKIFDLRNCMIHNPDFTGTTFYSADIYNVAFREETVFDHIKVENHLNFLGGADHSIFEGVTHFDIDFEKQQGSIYFENVNLSTLLKPHKERLFEFEKRENSKIEIGSGCIKYRVISNDFTYLLNDFHHHLIREIGQSFASFFTQYNGFNLGLEVRSKTKKEIVLFYFTDDDISKEVFLQMLGGASERIFGAMPKDRLETSSHQDAVVNFQIDLIRSITKIAYQIQKQNWDISDSKAFFSALNLSQNIYLDEQSTHAFLQQINVNDLLKSVKGLSVNVNQKGDKNTFVGFITSDKTNIEKQGEEK